VLYAGSASKPEENSISVSISAMLKSQVCSVWRVFAEGATTKNTINQRKK
jgi:hypothetical protein